MFAGRETHSPSSMKDTLYGASWPSAIRCLPWVVDGPPQRYSTKSAYSSGVMPQKVVTIGVIPMALHRSTNSNVPQPETRS